MKIWGIFSGFDKRSTQYSNNDSMKVQVIYTFIYEHKSVQESVSSIIVFPRLWNVEQT
jgi:hypothetical protein